VIASIIIVNYKSARLLARLLESISRYHQGLEREIIIVNNSPEEAEPLQTIVKGDSDIHLIEPRVNIYFAPSINRASGVAKGKYVVFINVDAYFEKPSLQHLVHFLDNHPDYGVAVGAMINEYDHSMSPSTNRLPSFRTELFRHTFIGPLLQSFHWVPAWYKKYLYVGWDRRTDRDIEAGCDAFLMIRREIFRSFGGYSSGLLMYLTEEDLGRSLQKRNLKMRYVASAPIVHQWSHSSKQVALAKIQAIMLWDRYIYFLQQYGKIGSLTLTTLTALLNPYTLRSLPSIIHWLRVIRNEIQAIYQTNA
jgi:N-acetylglucosaminyl-diphospho-decaprenol L-rhamnosyltransferase